MQAAYYVFHSLVHMCWGAEHNKEYVWTLGVSFLFLGRWERTISGKCHSEQMGEALLARLVEKLRWQWRQVWIYDRSTSHSVYPYSERLALIGTPNKLIVKVPNYMNIDQGSCASQITITHKALLKAVIFHYGPKRSWVSADHSLRAV